MAIAKTLDLVRERRAEFVAGELPRFVSPAPSRILAVTGKGQPGGPEFRADVAALQATALKVRAARRKGGRDFKLPPLEALWWAPRRAGSAWSWKAFLRVPAFVTERDVKAATDLTVHRGKGAADKIQLENLEEGDCVQALHRGPQATEHETLARLEEAARAEGRSLAPPHHEIYLSDPDRTPPEELRTIVRHPLAFPVLGGRASAEHDRTPVSIRQRRLGAEPQHRGRELR